jgi:hypothetical protein
MFLALSRTYLPMDRHTIVMVIFSLLLSTGLFLLPVNAEDNAGQDTSGFDWDIGRAFVEVLDRGPMALIDPPRWQWDAERYMDEGDKCAAQCELLYKKYIHAPENSNDLGSIFDKGIASCNCAQKYYNKAFELTKDDDYVQQAEIFEAGTGLYETIGMTKEALQMRNAARVARAQAATSSFSLPLSPWVVITALIGGLLLIVRKRE